MTSALKKKLLLSLNRPLRPQDVFATSLYTGNGGTQTITNGLDLAGKGGLLWTKARSFGASHALFDTLRGRSSHLATDLTRNEQTSTNAVDFLANGFGVGADNVANVSGQTYVAWCIRFARRFAVEVLYTGNGQSGRQIPHGLGDVPGMMVVRPRNLTADWQVYHRSLPTPQSNSLRLNLTDGATGSIALWNNTAPTATDFTLGSSGNVNNNGTLYVAYLFAHNPDLIDCGSYVGNGNENGPFVTCGTGWTPQFILQKAASRTGDWSICDTARGIPTGGNTPRLRANTSEAEITSSVAADLTATGFQVKGRGTNLNSFNELYLYLAIRAPT